MKSHKTMVGSVDRRVLAFTAGRDSELDRALIEADCLGTAAHVTMLAGLRLPRPLFTRAQRDRVVRELVSVMRDARRGRFRIRPQDQDVHLAVERRLTERLGDLGRRVHTARSRNDQVATDLRLYARMELAALTLEALDLAGVLLAFAGRHMRTPMAGRTHLQPAMPSSAGLWASAHAESLLDDARLLRAAAALADRSPLGAAAGYGVALPIDRRRSARLLGFAGPVRNVIYAGNARGKCEFAILSAVSQVMLTLSRLSEDMILFLTPEFGYFRLPPEFGTGSSIMPQKCNPDVFELVRARSRRVRACCEVVAAIVDGLPSGYQRDLQETKEPFLEGLALARACLGVLLPVVQALQPVKAALLAGFRPGVFAADEALALAARGVPFRRAYDQIKRRLDEVGAGDARAATRRFAAGGPADPDLPGVRREAVALRRAVCRERSGLHGALGRLLGVRYPELTSAPARAGRGR